MPDGNATRYPGNAYDCTQTSGCMCTNLGGTAEVFKLLSYEYEDKSFFYTH